MSQDSPTADLASLPDDPELLKPLVAQLLEDLRKRDGRIEQLEHRLELLLRRLYGRQSERLDPRQQTLFASPGDDEESPAPPSPPPAPSPSASAPSRSRHGRRRIPDTLRRVEVVHDLSPAEKEALGGEAKLVLIGREVTEQLEWEPSCLYVVRHVQLSYARRDQLVESGPSLSERNVVTAAKPPQAIPGGLAGPGLLAQVLVSKYADHLPLHRLERITARQGMLLPRQTTCDWALACAERLAPLVEVMRQEVLASAVLHLDDTPVKIRDGHRKRRHTGYFWTQVGDERHPLIVFHYTPHHRRDGPEELLQGFRGYLQADAANLYDGLYRQPHRGLVEVGCWMHARRKFIEARTSDRLRAELALAQIGRLYALERELQSQRESLWRDLSWKEFALRVAAARQERARPILDELRAWMDAEAERLLPKSPVRQAIEYARGNWAALCRYTEDGRLDIDNGEAERALRGIALGRRNWLFCGSDRGGRAAAVHFSLIASCHRHHVDPFAYLRDLLTRLPALGPRPERANLRALLPDRWTTG